MIGNIQFHKKTNEMCIISDKNKFFLSLQNNKKMNINDEVMFDIQKSTSISFEYEAINCIKMVVNRGIVSYDRNKGIFVVTIKNKIKQKYYLRTLSKNINDVIYKDDDGLFIIEEPNKIRNFFKEGDEVFFEIKQNFMVEFNFEAINCISIDKSIRIYK